MTCELCGGPLRRPSKHGVCSRNPDCRREYKRRSAAAHPDRKAQSAKHYRQSARGRAAAVRVQARAQAMAARRAQLLDRILDLRRQGWSKDAIRAELKCGASLVEEVLRGIPASTCKICGGSMKSGSTTGICQKTPDCKRAHSQFSKRFRARRTAIGESDLTTPYLISIWTGRCAREDCNKALAPSGQGPRDDWAHLDRIFPAEGYRIGNVRWLCARCNRRKQDLTSAELQAMLTDQLQAEARARKALNLS